MQSLKFGPAGLGSVKDAVSALEMYHKLGLKACEIAFTYSIYIKRKEDAVKIRKAAKKFNVQLSIHAPYWINLNSDDKEKVKKSKERILECCKIGNYLGVKRIVFHPGYYGKATKEQTYNKIRMEILNLQEEIKKNKWKIKLCPETTGRLNVFGNIDEIKKLVDETKCGFCIDFAHLLARDKKIQWKELKKLFSQKDWHCHFSGIEYGEKGEKHHKRTEEKYWKWLFKNLPKNKNITIINESPTPIEDSVLGLRVFHPMPLTKSFFVT